MNGILLALGLLSVTGLSNACGGSYEAPGQFIVGRSDYSNNLQCSYTVTGNGVDPIVLTFPTFDVEAHSSCAWDHVEVIDSEGQRSGKLCGTSAGTYISTWFTIEFKTDGSVTREGFTADFQYQIGCHEAGGICQSNCGKGEASITNPCQSGVCCIESPLPDDVCGKVPASFKKGSRIINGVDAAENSWPWQASLQTNTGFHFCGGSLIADKWVVTAAHCVTSDTSNIQVVLGEHDQGTISTKEKSVRVARIISHPQYTGQSSDGFPNDIALLKLTEAVTFDGTRQPVCVPEKGSEFNTNGNHICWITGWGLKEGGAEAPILQELRVNLLSNYECGQIWGTSAIRESHVCLMHNDNSVGGACNGDSGGPLSCIDPSVGHYDLTGATSWGVNGCEAQGYPSVYTRVSEYRDWIVETLYNSS